MDTVPPCRPRGGRAGALRHRLVEAVGVDDRDDDDARLLQQVGDAGVPPVVAHQVVGELHRHLARRPLARVVQAHHEEHGLAARLGALDVVRDLDAVDGAALERLVRQREPLDDARLDGRELAQVVVVVGERPVGVPSARQRGRWRRCRRRPGTLGCSARSRNARSGTSTSYESPAADRASASAAVWSTTSTNPGPACSVRSSPRPPSRSLSARVGVSTRTSCAGKVVDPSLRWEPRREPPATARRPRSRPRLSESFGTSEMAQESSWVGGS